MLSVGTLTHLHDVGEMFAEERAERGLSSATARFPASRALRGVLRVELLERLRERLAIALQVPGAARWTTRRAEATVGEFRLDEAGGSMGCGCHASGTAWSDGVEGGARRARARREGEPDAHPIGGGG